MFRNERQAIIDGGILCVACVLWLLIYAGLTSCAKPTQHTSTPPAPGAPLSVAPSMTAPSAVLSPFLCVVQPSTAYCQATVDTVLRRGQRETRVQRGSVIGWSNPQGSGPFQVWFGCTGVNPCAGNWTFSSAATVTPTAGVVVKGKEGIIPNGSIGIISGTIENNAFTSITDRWTGGYAPPLLAPGPGIGISCTDDVCTVGTK
jgi:hypothetical protein